MTSKITRSAAAHDLHLDADLLSGSAPETAQDMREAADDLQTGTGTKRASRKKKQQVDYQRERRMLLPCNHPLAYVNRGRRVPPAPDYYEGEPWPPDPRRD